MRNETSVNEDDGLCVVEAEGLSLIAEPRSRTQASKGSLPGAGSGTTSRGDRHYRSDDIELA